MMGALTADAVCEAFKQYMIRTGEAPTLLRCNESDWCDMLWRMDVPPVSDQRFAGMQTDFTAPPGEWVVGEEDTPLPLTAAEWVLLDWLVEYWGGPWPGVQLLAWRARANKPERQTRGFVAQVRKALRYAAVVAWAGEQGRGPPFGPPRREVFDLVEGAGVLWPASMREAPAVGPVRYFNQGRLVPALGVHAGPRTIAAYQTPDKAMAERLRPEGSGLAMMPLLLYSWEEAFLPDEPWKQAWV